MRKQKNRWGLWTAIALTCSMTLGCGLFSRFGFNTTSKASPTPTTINGGGGGAKILDQIPVRAFRELLSCNY